LSAFVDPAAVDGAALICFIELVSFRQDRLGRGEDGLGVVQRHDDQAIGDDGRCRRDSPGCLPITIGTLISPGRSCRARGASRRSRTPGSFPGAARRKSRNRAPDHHAADAALLARAFIKLADDGVIVEPRRRRPRHVARRGVSIALWTSKIVSGRRPNRERLAQSLAPLCMGRSCGPPA